MILFNHIDGLAILICNLGLTLDIGAIGVLVSHPSIHPMEIKCQQWSGKMKQLVCIVIVNTAILGTSWNASGAVIFEKGIMADLLEIPIALYSVHVLCTLNLNSLNITKSTLSWEFEPSSLSFGFSDTSFVLPCPVKPGTWGSFFRCKTVDFTSIKQLGRDHRAMGRQPVTSTKTTKKNNG